MRTALLLSLLALWSTPAAAGRDVSDADVDRIVQLYVDANSDLAAAKATRSATDRAAKVAEVRADLASISTLLSGVSDPGASTLRSSLDSSARVSIDPSTFTLDWVVRDMVAWYRVSEGTWKREVDESWGRLTGSDWSQVTAQDWSRVTIGGTWGRL